MQCELEALRVKLHLVETTREDEVQRRLAFVEEERNSCDRHAPVVVFVVHSSSCFVICLFWWRTKKQNISIKRYEKHPRVGAIAIL